MNKGNATVIIVVIVIVVVGFFLLRGGDNNSGAIMIEEIDLDGVVTHEVVLTSGGYQPTEITVNKGEAVVFSTTAGNLFWPASNIHPSHTIYPEFDPQVPISPEETWAFIFEDVGAWNYHDHLSPVYRGVVNVVSN